jgi:hypothetical protein
MVETRVHKEVKHMLRSVKDLRGYIIGAIDGEIGQVHELYFDDQSWIVRYLVVDTGTWLPGRRVLLSPMALGQPDWETHVLPVGLTKEQVENSPPIAVDKPVSRQMESDLHAYYGWRPYWSGPAPVAAQAVAAAEAKRRATGEWADPHLRSTREVIGYHIEASDGEIGHVEDLIVDDEAWILRYLVIDTRNWLPGKKVLVAPAWTKAVDWAQRRVHVDLSRETIENGPTYDPAAPVNREYELQLYDYYGRPYYW